MLPWRTVAGGAQAAAGSASAGHTVLADLDAEGRHRILLHRRLLLLVGLILCELLALLEGLARGALVAVRLALAGATLLDDVGLGRGESAVGRDGHAAVAGRGARAQAALLNVLVVALAP